MIYKIIWVIQTVFVRLIVKKIGYNSYFAKPLLILGGKKIIVGNKVRIFPGARMEVHREGRIIIQDNISIGQNLHLISSTEPVIIHRDTTISGNVFITNIDHDYQEIDKHILEQEYIIKTTSIGENCFIGYGVVIQAGTILGKQCIVGSNSVVRGHFPDYSVIVGSPARVVKRYNINSKFWENTDSKGLFLSN